jgi:hypothetical protein
VAVRGTSVEDQDKFDDEERRREPAREQDQAIG